MLVFPTTPTRDESIAKVASLPVVTVLLILAGVLCGCGGSPTRATEFPVPANVVLSPAEILSLDIGATQMFTGTPQNARKVALVEPISFSSSNTAVMTIANNGNACAGSWDSLSNPQVCTPGPVGVAQVTASAKGVSSPPTLVFVHQHVDSIKVTSITPSLTDFTSLTDCGLGTGVSGLSKDQNTAFQAAAFSRGVDITSTVGTFTWQTLNPNVVSITTATLSSPVAGLLPGQAKVTAHTPGRTSIFASVSNVNSMPFDFTTCPVQRITLSANGSTAGPVVIKKGTSTPITPTVVDTQGTTITGIPLTWCSSDPAAVSVGSNNCSTNTGATVSAGTPLIGGGSVMASCTPPSCNIGLQPVLPIYPENALQVVVTPGGSTAAQATSVFVSTTDCDTIPGITTDCNTAILPIDTSKNTVGSPIRLPATPNSLLFNRQGTKAFLGTNSGLFGTRGLMVVNASSSPASVSGFIKAAPGKVLAVAPDGNRVIVSDTVDTPNQVFIVDTSGSTVTLQIAGATAADFSRDGLKAYILSGDSLFVYSTVAPLKSIALSAAAKDVSFLSNGSFAYLAGGDPAGVSVQAVCDDSAASSPTLSTPAPPPFIRGLPDGNVLAVDSPGVDLITVSTTPIAPPQGCPPTVSNARESFSFGQGSFVAKQLLVSADGARAYVIPGNLASVLVFNISSRTSFGILIAGNATPVQATLTLDGNFLYIAASDGTVHVLDTQTATDVQQLTLPLSSETQPNGLCTGVPVACKPNLIAARP
jgi:trimeric autotransporter adhesin